ncbi:hypothetical protein [Candidatus Manganitrophus noduliformans]|uniref:Terminase large subunit gp17-like C-terminal domain-containing protein n=1 Tax=Candidatus Manganitrophus noduliformans TaxID=2606439 RepID=A0A7X6I9P2_9BACT|nr:hypothetical protein [Candidatus Manganitrophus noduliformans]NKE69881.1 hypothetical protein [Candidatus Manganitrophus noduliformans]
MTVQVKESEPTPEEIERELFTVFRTYAVKCLKVQTKKGKLISFKFNVAQDLLDRIVNEIIAAGRLVRVVVLKARREGVSTYVEGRFYWKVSLRENRYAATVTHEPEATETLFNMTKRFHDHVDPLFQPPEKYNNKGLLQFDGLDSAFRVGTAEKEHFGSGQGIHYLHLSEVSKWPAHTQVNLLTSALQAVPDDLDTEIYYESTAYGIGGAFHHRYLTARYRYYAVLENGKPVLKFEINEDADPNDVYTSVFFPWFIFPEYRMKAPADFVRTKEEVEYAKLHGVDNDQLYWRRYTIANKCNPTGENLGKTPEMIFWQEYPSTPEEAFLATGRTIFDSIKINALKKAAPKPIARYDCLVSTGQWITKPDGMLRVWEEPIPGRRYVIGADVAEGLIHGDFSSADVVDHLTGKQVAQWHGRVDPDLFGNILYWLGVRYCTAWIAPERNNHGYTTVKKLVDLRYPQIYVELIPEPPGKPRKRYGWLTGKATKHLCIDFLVTILREGRHGIQCAETFGEMLSFVLKDDGTMGAQEGLNDDRCMSIAIAQYVRTVLPLPSMAQTMVPAGGAVQSVRTPPPPGAFT